MDQLEQPATTPPTTLWRPTKDEVHKLTTDGTQTETWEGPRRTHSARTETGTLRPDPDFCPFSVRKYRSMIECSTFTLFTFKIVGYKYQPDTHGRWTARESDSPLFNRPQKGSRPASNRHAPRSGRRAPFRRTSDERWTTSRRSGWTHTSRPCPRSGPGWRRPSSPHPTTSSTGPCHSPVDEETGRPKAGQSLETLAVQREK